MGHSLRGITSRQKQSPVPRNSSVCMAWSVRRCKSGISFSPPKPPFATRAHFRTTAAMTAELDGNRQRARAIVFICDVDAFQCVAGCSGTA